MRATSAELDLLGSFYLGRTDQGPYQYPSKDLLTHGLVIGMTGSGKTGLSVALLEEAAIDGVPALVIDPKGDLSNLALTFPALAPADFAPWVPEGKSPEAEAARWREGLAAWGQDGARIGRLREACDITVFTPGSRAGTPLSLLGSLKAPAGALPDDAEALAERASSVAGSLLGFVDVDADPVQSREHILLTTLLHRAWSEGRDFDLEALVHAIQEPGIAKLGVLDTETFFPKTDRFQLALRFNALLSSPSFQSWLEGTPLDVGALIRTPQGKPRISIVSIAHLNDAERMFVVSLVLGQLVSWMRTQPGTSSLRALVYMDEIAGYFPPVAMPPSKRPLLLLLKQARAFGLGVLLATQNPVDLDYKGLSNCGTWFIGRLQTERDKARVMDGLLAADGGPKDRGAMEALLSGLAARRFLVHDVHQPAPVVIESRWALSYLRGPLTKEELKRLPRAEPQAPPAQESGTTASSGRPVIPPGIAQIYLPVQGPAPRYQPMILGAASVRFADKKTELDLVRHVVFAAPITDGPVPVRWEDAKWVPFAVADLAQSPLPQASFAPVPASALNPKSYSGFQKAFVAWLAQNQGVARFRYAKLKLISAVGESEAAFRARIAGLVDADANERIAALRAKLAPKMEALAERIRAAEQALAVTQAQIAAARTDSLAQAGGAALLGALGRGGMGAAAVRAGKAAVRGAAKAKKDEAARQAKADKATALREQWKRLDDQFRAEAQAIAQQSQAGIVELESIVVRPKKADLNVELFALAFRG